MVSVQHRARREDERDAARGAAMVLHLASEDERRLRKRAALRIAPMEVGAQVLERVFRRASDSRPAYAAAVGRMQRFFCCSDCGFYFADRQVAEWHCILDGHRIIEHFRREIVRVDLDDPPEVWEDGAGQECERALAAYRAAS